MPSAISVYTQVTNRTQITIRRSPMSHVYKIIELTGSSPISSDEAVKNAIAAASQ